MRPIWREQDASDGIYLGDSRGKQERLLGLRADISPDGDATSFSCQFTNQPPFKCLVPIEEISFILHEIRTASNLMIDRQRLKLDRGAEKWLEMCAHALRPRYNDVVIEPFTGDRIFVMQFDDHAPLAIRMSVAEVALGLRKLSEAVARSMH